MILCRWFITCWQAILVALPSLASASESAGANHATVGSPSLLSQPRRVPVKRFAPNDNRTRQYLDRFGFVVVKVATEDQVRRCLHLFWDFMEGLGVGFNRSLKATWNDEHWPSVDQIIGSYGIGQSDFMWTVRSLPGVRKAFETLWGTPDLLVSLDAMSAVRPGDQISGETLQYHLDQNPVTQPTLVGLQGMVNLIQTHTWSPAIGVVRFSHKMFPSFWLKRYGGRGSHRRSFFSVPSFDAVGAQLRKDLIVPLLDPGDLLIFDSRTVHTYVDGVLPAIGGRLSGLHRLSALVTMQPRSESLVQGAQAYRRIVANRQLAVCRGLTLGEFWAHLSDVDKCVPFDHPALNGKAGPTHTPRLAWLTAEQWLLVGSQEEDALLLAEKGCQSAVAMANYELSLASA